MHTLNVCLLSTQNGYYKYQMNDGEKNAIKWIALFHDLAKRGRPEFGGRDHIHPFMSAKLCLEIFKEMGFFFLSGKE